jgi:hypothetical protein
MQLVVVLAVVGQTLVKQVRMAAQAEVVVVTMRHLQRRLVRVR